MKMLLALLLLLSIALPALAQQPTTTLPPYRSNQLKGGANMVPCNPTGSATTLQDCPLATTGNSVVLRTDSSGKIDASTLPDSGIVAGNYSVFTGTVTQCWTFDAAGVVTNIAAGACGGGGTGNAILIGSGSRLLIGSGSALLIGN